MQQRHHHKKGFELLRSNSETIAHKTRMGFNLIEAAIVLAVVGGVIGAIWVAASNFYENYKVNKTDADLQLIVRNVQGLISIRDAESLPGSYPLTATLIAADAIPKDLVNGNSVKNPFGGGLSVMSFKPRFAVYIDAIPPTACVKLTVKISAVGFVAGRFSSGGGGYNPNLSFIVVNSWSSETDGGLPVSFSKAKSACNLTGNTISFHYGYTRNN